MIPKILITDILNNILGLMKQYLADVEEGKIFVQYGLLKMMNRCKGFFSQNFSNGGMHDSNEFLKNIIKLLKINTQESNLQIS